MLVFFFHLPAFDTELMTVSMEMICTTKSQPRKKQSECLDLHQDYLAFVMMLIMLLTSSVVALDTMSYSTMPGLMTSTKSRTARLLLMLGSWKLEILLDLPAPCN